jgi:hypothetical protein
MEEHAISHAQNLDLVYSQMGTLYDLLPDAPCPSTSTTSTTPAASHVADGMCSVPFCLPRLLAHHVTICTHLHWIYITHTVQYILHMHLSKEVHLTQSKNI